MKSNSRVLAIWFAAIGGGCLATSAAANTYTAVLTSVFDNELTGNIDSSTATWVYDDVTKRLSQTGGTLDIRFDIPFGSHPSLYRDLVSGLVIGNHAAAAASTFSCSDGTYGPLIGANGCGNYAFANGVDDSTLTYGPGTAHSRTIGGDDYVISGKPEHSISDYDDFFLGGLTGSNLTLQNSHYVWNLTVTLQAASAGDDAITVFQGPVTPIGVGANDINFADPVSITITTQPTKGTIISVSPPGPAAGMYVTYLPNIGATSRSGCRRLEPRSH